MNVLKQYIIRKGLPSQMVQQVTETGQITVPPNWTNYFADEHMLFSHRCNRYTHKRCSDAEKLHAHVYYELIILIRGEVEYIQNDKRIYPKPYTVIWCPAGNMHAMRVSACEYERYIMYFSPEFFSENGEKGCPILQFTQNPDGFAIQVDASQRETMMSLLERIERVFQSDLPYKRTLIKALLVELFSFFNTVESDPFSSQLLNDPIADVKKYIDQAYADISGVGQIAAQFHYSREHLSRKFKSRFNITISEYLSRRRVVESARLLTQMSITEACYAVGFRNPSVFIAAFKKSMGCLPSEYKKQLLK